MQQVKVYEGQITALLKRLKRFSLASCLISTSATPYILMVSDKPGKAAVGAFMLAACVGTTIFFHRMSKRYATQMYWIPQADGKSISSNDRLAISTLDLLAREKTQVFELKDLKLLNSPFNTYIDRKTNARFFLQPEGISGQVENINSFMHDLQLDEKLENKTTN